MAITYKALATVTVGAGGASVMDFTSIPQTYTDLLVVASQRSTNGSPDQNINFNSTSSNLSSVYFFNVGGSVTNGTASVIPLVGNPKSSYNASAFGLVKIYISNYTSANNKSVSIESIAENNSSTDFFQTLAGGIWSDATAITSIRLAASLGYAEYSTATLYGIKNS